MGNNLEDTNEQTASGAEKLEIGAQREAGSDLNLCSLTMGKNQSGTENLSTEQKLAGVGAPNLKDVLPSLTIDFGSGNPKADTASSNTPQEVSNGAPSGTDASQVPRNFHEPTHREAQRLLDSNTSFEERMGALQLAVGENGRVPFANENIDRSPEAVHWRAATNDVIQGMSAADVQRFNEANRDTNPRLQIRDMTPAERQEHINHNPGQNYQRILDVSMRNGTGQYTPTDSIPEVAMHGTGQHSSAPR